MVSLLFGHSHAKHAMPSSSIEAEVRRTAGCVFSPEGTSNVTSVGTEHPALLRMPNASSEVVMITPVDQSGPVGSGTNGVGM
jgi:hypothetical protein